MPIGFQFVRGSAVLDLIRQSLRLTPRMYPDECIQA